MHGYELINSEKPHISRKANIDERWKQFLLMSKNNDYNVDFQADGVDYSAECPCARHANLTTMRSLTSKGLDTSEWRVIFAKGCITPGDYEK